MAHPRKFRFAVQTTSSGLRKSGASVARKVEALGYTTLFMSPITSSTHSSRDGRDLVRGGRHRAPAHRHAPCSATDYKHPAVTAKGGGHDRPALRRDASSSASAPDGSAPTTTRSDSPTTRRARGSIGLGEADSDHQACVGTGKFDFDGKHYRIRAYDGVPQAAYSSRARRS